MVPEKMKPITPVDVWHFGIQVNLKAPSDELFHWFKELHTNCSITSGLYADKRIVKLVEAFWSEYRTSNVLYLLFTMIPVLLVFLQPLFWMKQLPMPAGALEVQKTPPPVKYNYVPNNGLGSIFEIIIIALFGLMVVYSIIN